MIEKRLLPAIMIFFILITGCYSTVGGDAEQIPDQHQNTEETKPVKDNEVNQSDVPTEILESDDAPKSAEIIELDDNRTSMRVLWTIAEYVLGDNFVGHEADVKSMLFKPLDITETQIIFLDKMCNNVVFMEDTVVISDYLSNNWKETPGSLCNDDGKEAMLIRTNCDLFGFREYLRLNDGRLIVPFENVFYFFQPNIIY